MGFYFSIYFLLVFLATLEILSLKKRLTNLIYWVLCGVFLVLSFVRFETGTDWDNYYNFFKNISYTDLSSASFEIGFGLVNKWVGSFTTEYSVLLVFLGLILFSFQSIAIKRMSPYPLVSLLFIWGTQFANILFVRQWVAVAILFYSVKYIERKQFFYFLLLVGLAASFHRTSWVFLIAWWIYNNKWTIKSKILILLISIAASSFFLHLLSFLTDSLGGGILQAKLSYYLDSDYNARTNEELNIYLIIIRGFANKFLILGLGFYLLDKISVNQNRFRGYLNLYWFGAVLYFSTISISIAFVRISYAFDLFQIILIPYFLKYITDKKSRLIVYFIFCLYVAFRMWQIVNGPYTEEFIPYKTILY